MMRVSYESASLHSDDQRDVFARFWFDGADAGERTPRDFQTGLRQVGGAPVCEVWRSDQPSQTDVDDGVAMVISERYLLLCATADGPDMRAASHDAYRRLLKTQEARGYPNIVRTWNSVPDINVGDGDDEHYKRFCVGRSEAFDAYGPTAGAPPAATAVGSVEPGPLRVFLLASHSEPRLLENPRQVSAYRYPRQYGPRSPAFSRAAVLNGEDAPLLYLSGTAAITGHESRHVGDAGRQIAETLENIRQLATSAGVGPPHAVLRVYLREAELADEALSYLNETFTHPPQLVAVVADLCRKELLVEIDGVLRAATGVAA
ncbi:MAG: pteridine-dependent deoxygenase like protein [Pseudomonadota bacterium]